ncbi:NAD(P)/FAD-dependent oxidoreductase [Sphingomonas sp.]|uniref:NAD(P)/FAD-dependent oxidoreductase n=1 Tax=Sphingomonas sp. TaxID=28214 RepID=UPI0025ED875F|nr:NAD(P)/FAD-dependent oxidoreductase [Sphingomonas sp.]
MLDCVVVGGGPAGLTAAIYLARFHLDVRVIDAGNSRAATIPMTRNHAGFPDGIAGVELVDRMRMQARRYGAELVRAEVDGLKVAASGLHVSVGDEVVATRSVLLATGVVNRRPPMPDDLHATALALGLLRYCPICDGYEVTDRRVAVLGTGGHGTREAIFLRGYTADVTLIAPGGQHDLSPEQRALLAKSGIAMVDGPADAFAIDGDQIRLRTVEGDLRFDSLYPALGSDINSALAIDIGAARSDEGCLIVDAHQRTNIARLYAAGDVVKGLDQISHAMGEGGVAATTIRNDLASEHALLRNAPSR